MSEGIWRVMAVSARTIGTFSEGHGVVVVLIVDSMHRWTAVPPLRFRCDLRGLVRNYCAGSLCSTIHVHSLTDIAPRSLHEVCIMHNYKKSL
jgi:hypothetical protein